MPLATYHDATREYARNVGMNNLDQAWILSPYDTWERNPFYSGPPVAHPEDTCEQFGMIDREWDRPTTPKTRGDYADDEIPF